MGLQTLLRPLVRVSLGWYYRSITIANAERIPREGPIFLAVNHPNALVDALVIGSMLSRPVLFTAKATIFANPVMARFLRAAGVVPLRRASDERAGEPGAAPAPDAARNSSAFEAVADALAAGRAVVIFPEGRSHDEPRLGELRSGLARMALMARDERGVRGIRIVPVGLLFERKEEPRSRILLQVGQPIEVDAFPRRADAVGAIGAAVRQRLEDVTLNFETAADAERIHRAAETLSALVAPHGTIDQSSPTLRETLAMVRRTDRVNRALREHHDPALEQRVTAAEARLVHFRERLRHLGVLPEDIAIETGTQAGLRFLVRELVRAVVLVPIALWGRATHYVPVRLARALALRSVKSRDEPAMRTLVIGLVLVLVAYAVETTIVWMLFGGWWALLFFLTLVPSASSDFRYGDRSRRLRARALAWIRFRRAPAVRRELVEEADWLRAEAGAIEQIAMGGR